jgi:pSer/pThr/pTyr-binding forkhead associated (FHA) protein
MLDPNPPTNGITRILQQTTNLFYSDEFFGEDFILSLKVRGSTDYDRNNTYEVRPQTEGEVTIGRWTEGSEIVPTIDLAAHNAEERGVSRRHLSVHYDSNDKVLRAVDRGSANGTYVNGQHLHRNEIRVLRNGDELRLGRLVMSVKFYTAEYGTGI